MHQLNLGLLHKLIFVRDLRGRLEAHNDVQEREKELEAEGILAADHVEDHRIIALRGVEVVFIESA